MATIVNARDVLLQSGARLVDVTLPSNLIPDAVREITLSPSTGVFKTDASGGTTTPTSITLTLTRKYVTGTATFTVIEGTATLTGSGDTRTLTFANMSSERVVIRATVVFNSVTYTANSTIVKVKDGTAGTKGVDGRRGSVDLYVIGSAWSDSVANNAILTNTGSAVKYAGDKVTIYNNAGFAQTKYWDGISTWATGQIINGNVLVSGTVTSDAIGTNTLSAVNIDTTGRIKAEGDSAAYADYPQYRGAIFGVNTSLNGNADYRKGVIGYSLGGAGVSGLGHTGPDGAYSLAIGVQGVGWFGGNFRSNVTNGIGVHGQGFMAGYFVSDQTNGIGAQVSASGASSLSLQITGTARVQWGPYVYSAPPGGEWAFMGANGTWHRPSLSSIQPDTSDTPKFQFSTDNGVSWTTILLRRI